MSFSKLQKILKMCTPNQIKRIAELLYLDEKFLNLYFCQRKKQLELEYLLNMSKNKIQNEKKYCLEKIINALNDKTISKEIQSLLNIKNKENL